MNHKIIKCVTADKNVSIHSYTFPLVRKDTIRSTSTALHNVSKADGIDGFFLSHGIEQKLTKTVLKDRLTSTPVVRTGVYPHMPIAVTTVVKDTFGSVFSNTRYKILCMYSCRLFYDSSRHRLRHRPSPRNTNSLQHWPSPTMRRLVSHSTHGSRRSCKFVTPG